MPSYTVEKSIQIAAPLERVLETVTDFHSWPSWSPWLYVEPDATLKFTGDAGQVGHGYTWQGERIGAGEMRLSEVRADGADYELVFLKPFRSTAKVGFVLSRVGDETLATWLMSSKMPWFMAPMIKMMKMMIGMDYERGLRMLKDQLELGEVQSRAEFVGVVELPRFEYVGTTHQTNIAEISTSAAAAFGALHEKGVEGSAVFTLILKHKFMSGDMTYVAGIESPEGSAPGLTAGSDGGFKAIKVVHTGPYHHIGNGWALAMNLVRSGPYKMHKKRHHLERYVNDPRTTAPEDLITEIFIPIR